eukprot:594688-Heterocapsa_arctica.AAC.2
MFRGSCHPRLGPVLHFLLPPRPSASCWPCALEASPCLAKVVLPWSAGWRWSPAPKARPLRTGFLPEPQL